MGHLLPAISQGNESRDQSSFPIAQSLVHQSSICSQDVSDVTAALRRTLDSGTQPPASIIHAATEFARILTGAHGVALGVRIKGVLVCRARSGDLAPELGCTLNGDSGISGQCLHSGETLLCDDTETNEHVDHEACRALGVRSIVTVPVRRNEGIIGILEAFSRQVSGFSVHDAATLQALTEVIEAAHALEMIEQQKAALADAMRRAPLLTRAIPPIAGPVVGESKLSRHILGGRPPARLSWIAAVAAVALLLGTLGVWLSWHDPTPEAAVSEAPAPIAPSKVDVKPEPRHTTFLMKPEAGIVFRRPRHSPGADVLRKAAEISPVSDGSQVGGPNSQADEVGEGFIRSANPDVPQPGTVKIETPGSATALNELSTTAGVMPALEARVSEGVIEARLIHRVQPVYPPRARAQHLSGDVTLNATITEAGILRDIGVVHGSPVLAAAAIEAVKQWRYTPSLLDGKPVPVQKEITVVFTLP